MIERIKKTTKTTPKTTNNVSPKLSGVLNINEDYALARAKFLLLKDHCMDMLWTADQNGTFKSIAEYYLVNSADYFLSENNFENYSPEEIDVCKENYSKFRWIVAQITGFTEEQNLRFLENLKILYEKTTTPGENPIVVMENVIKNVLENTSKPEHIDLTQYDTTDRFLANQTKVMDNMHAISNFLKKILIPGSIDLHHLGHVFASTWMAICTLAWTWKSSEAADIYNQIYRFIDIAQKMSDEDKLVVYDILDYLFSAKSNDAAFQWQLPILFFFKTLHEKLPQYFT
jgi:hypothetical protein